MKTNAEEQMSMKIEDVVTMIAPDDLLPNPYQPKSRAITTPEEAREGWLSLERSGLIHFPVVRKAGVKGKYEVGDGWQRRNWYLYGYYEQKLDKYARVPCVVKELDDRQMADLILDANAERKDLNPIEWGEYYKKYLAEFKVTQEELGRSFGISQGEIANTIRLLELPEAVQKKVISHEISESHGRALLTLKDEKKMVKAAEDIVKDHTSVADLERQLRHDVWNATLPLTQSSYSYSENPIFDLKACESCEKRQLLREPWGGEKEDRKPRCGDKKCWKEKQAAALQEQNKADLEKLAKEGITRIVERDWQKHESLSNGGPSKDCKNCEKRAAVKGYNNQFDIVCTGKACYRRHNDVKMAADREAQRKEAEKTGEYIDKIFAELDPISPPALLATIECLLKINDLDEDMRAMFVNAFGLFEIKLDEDGDLETELDDEKIMAAIDKKYEEDKVAGRDMFLRMISRLAFESMRSRYYTANPSDIKKILDKFKAGRLQGPAKDKKVLDLSEDEFKRRANGMPDILDGLEIKVATDGDKFHEIKLGIHKVTGESLKGCAIAIVYRAGISKSNSPEEILEALRQLPATPNRELLVGILEGKQ